MEVDRIIVSLRQQLPLLRERYRVQSVEVFGSYVRGEEGSDSDLDLLVTFTEPPGLLKFIELEYYLSDTLGVEVDLVLRDTLRPRIGQSVLSEAMPV